jgi:glycosyltransferase involved in cell wall biosynthesis
MTVEDTYYSGSPERPVWSVMIPAYNPKEGLLRGTLESVLAQDQGPEKMQIEIVDDCSPNGNCEELVRNIAGHRVAIHRESKNLGLAGIWNRCIERARGHYIHILHQDDLVYPGFYGALEYGLAEHPETGAAFCRHAYCDEEGERRYLSELERPEAGIFQNALENLVKRPCVQCAAIVVKKSTYERLGGFNRELTHALDWEMWIRIANWFPIWYEPQVLASWRQHDDATTPRQILDGENTRDIARAIDIWSRYLPAQSSAALAKVSRRRYATEALKLAEYLIRRGHAEGFRKQMASAFLCDQSLAIKWQALLLRLKFLIRPLFRRTPKYSEAG